MPTHPLPWQTTWTCVALFLVPLFSNALPCSLVKAAAAAVSANAAAAAAVSANAAAAAAGHLLGSNAICCGRAQFCFYFWIDADRL